MRKLALALVILGVPITSKAIDQQPIPPDSAGGLVLSISTPKLRYVIGEPIKIDAVLTNESSRTIWIRDIGCTVPFDLDVVCPGGLRHKVYACGVEISNCETVPLPPRQATYERVHPMTASAELSGAGTCALAIPGEHRVRLVYRTEHYWNRDVGRPVVFSNELALRFDLPSPVECEILGAMAFADKTRGETMWCMDWYQHSGEDTLQSVIALHSEHPATNYVRFQLADMLKLETGREEEALTLLLDLVNRDPSFWFEEVRLGIARQFRYVHRAPEGRPYLFEVFRRRPLLITNPDFAWEYLVNIGDQSPNWKDPIRTYRERREHGELRIEDYFPESWLRDP